MKMSSIVKKVLNSLLFFYVFLFKNAMRLVIVPFGVEYAMLRLGGALGS